MALLDNKYLIIIHKYINNIYMVRDGRFLVSVLAITSLRIAQVPLISRDRSLARLYGQAIEEEGGRRVDTRIV